MPGLILVGGAVRVKRLTRAREGGQSKAGRAGDRGGWAPESSPCHRRALDHARQVREADSSCPEEKASKVCCLGLLAQRKGSLIPSGSGNSKPTTRPAIIR